MACSSVERSLEKYEQYHRHPKNKAVHLIGIPAIIIGLGIALPIWLSILALIAYFTVALREAVIILFFASIGMLLSPVLPWYAGLLIVLTSFGIQTISHKIFDNNAPALFSKGGLLHALTAPIWLVREIFSLKN